MPYKGENIKEKYTPVLVKFMSFQNNTEYTNSNGFARDKLSKIVPSDIVRWFKYHAYGNPDNT